MITDKPEQGIDSMKTTNNKINVSNPTVVLNDGETFTYLGGCMIAFPSEDLSVDDIEDALKEDTLDTFTLGEPNDHLSLHDKCHVLQTIMGTTVNISLDSEMKTIVLRFT